MTLTFLRSEPNHVYSDSDGFFRLARCTLLWPRQFIKITYIDELLISAHERNKSGNYEFRKTPLICLDMSCTFWFWDFLQTGREYFAMTSLVYLNYIHGRTSDINTRKQEIVEFLICKKTRFICLEITMSWIFWFWWFLQSDKENYFMAWAYDLNYTRELATLIHPKKRMTEFSICKKLIWYI